MATATEQRRRADSLLRAVRLLKAAGRFRSNRERRAWQTSQRVADKNVPRVVNTLLLELRATRRDINVSAVTRAIASGNVKAVEEGLLLPNLDANLRAKYQTQIREVLNEAGVASRTLLPKNLIGMFGRFDLTNPRAINWARERSSELVREITEGTRRAIRRGIAEGIEQGVPVRTTARRLRSAVGLTERQWNQVSGFRAKQLRRGVDAATVERQADKLAVQIHRRRALNIARTETINASYQGREELWEQVADDGLVDRTQMKRKWIVTPDDRLDSVICAPMAGQIRGMDEPFLTGDGRLIKGPTAHPQCRCDVIVIPPGTSIFDDVPEETEGRRRGRGLGLAAAAAAAAIASRDAGEPGPGEEL